MGVKLNLNKAQRKVLNPGDYVVNIAKCEKGESKSKQPKLHLEFTVDGDTHPDVGGQRLFQDMSLQEQTWFRVVELVQAALGEVTADDEEGNFEFEPSDLVGQQVVAVVSVDDSFDNIPRNKVDRVYSIDQYGEPEATEGSES